MLKWEEMWLSYVVISRFSPPKNTKWSYVFLSHIHKEKEEVRLVITTTGKEDKKKSSAATKKPFKFYEAQEQ